MRRERTFINGWSRARRQYGTHSLLAVLFLSVLATVGHAEDLDLSNYRISFQETFQSLDISTDSPATRWKAHTPWHGDFGDAVFENPGPTGPFSLGPRGLRIIAMKDAAGKWHSGLICTMDKDGPGQHGFAQQFGYFEMRAKLPDGPGVWPAFWLIGIDKKTSAAEIDVLEYYGHAPNLFHNVMHVFQGGRDVLGKDNLVSIPYGQLTSNFNNFGVLIDADRTRFFLNRTQIWEQPTPPEYRQPMYILANLAIGGGWPSNKLNSPATMEVERITVYEPLGKARDR